MKKFRVAVLVSLCLFGTSFLIGCHQSQPSSVMAKISANPDIPTIQSTVEFRAVSTAFRSRDYSIALQLIEQLSKRSNLSPGDRIYLDRQAQICRAAMAHPSSSSIAAAAPLPSVAQPIHPAIGPITDFDCGPRALFFVCRQNNHPASLNALTRIARTQAGRGTSMAELARAANSVGFEARGVQMDSDALHLLKPPALAWVDGDHYIAVTSVHDDSATVFDPNRNGEEEMPLSTLLQRSGGIALVLTAKKI